MPSNSPAVNSLWLPAIALKTPVIIKPGQEEPWTPYRLIQAFIAAGVSGGGVRVLSDRPRGGGGDPANLRSGADLRRPEYHGAVCEQSGHPGAWPGFSKILIGDDCIENWREYVDVMVSSIADNGGRSCINASAIVVPRYAARDRGGPRRAAGADRTETARRSRGAACPVSPIRRWRTTSMARSSRI